jgi:hypothetical protein
MNLSMIDEPLWAESITESDNPVSHVTRVVDVVKVAQESLGVSEGHMAQCIRRLTEGTSGGTHLEGHGGRSEV